MSEDSLLIHKIAAALVDVGDTSLWIVGGAIRDALLHRSITDIDLVYTGDPFMLADSMSAQLPVTVAALDRQIGRVRLGIPISGIHIDITTIKDGDIIADLSARDFTINALAVPYTAEAFTRIVAGSVLADDIIDPFQGQQDLAKRIVRQVYSAAFTDDPLRIMRAARIAASLDFSIDAETTISAKAAVQQLSSVAPARITAELFGMFQLPLRGTAAMYLLDDLGALTTLVPSLAACRGVVQGSLHHWDVFDHTLAVIDELDVVQALLQATLAKKEFYDPIVPSKRYREGEIPHPTALDLAGYNTDVIARSTMPFAEGQSRLTLAKVAALFHDVGKPETAVQIGHANYRFPNHSEAALPYTQATIAQWQLGHDARRFIMSTVACHMRPGQMAGPHGLGTRAIRHFFRDAGDAALDIALFSLADHFAVYGPDELTSFWPRHFEAVVELVRRYYETPNDVIPPRLIDGNDLMNRYHLAPGPELHHLLQTVQEAYLDGTIATKAEALALVDAVVKH